MRLSAMPTKTLCDLYNEQTGALAFWHPRKRTVSFSGQREVTEKEARQKIIARLNQEKK